MRNKTTPLLAGCGFMIAVWTSSSLFAQAPPGGTGVPPRATGTERGSEPRSRRSQRVRMELVQVSSPNGQVQLSLLPNAERLTFVVEMSGARVLDPSPLSMRMDGYDLSTGIVFRQVERYAMRETFPWHGDHAVATNHCQGARILLEHDLAGVDYVLEVRAFDEGVAYRHVISGEAEVSRVPDEYSTFVIPEGATVWYAGLAAGHYEDTYQSRENSQVEAGEWSGPPLTFRLKGGAGYGAITEANLVDYSGMGLEADGRRGWTIGLGHRHPLNYPFELRYGRAEGKRLGQPAAVTGPITTPWRVILMGRNLHSLVNSDIVPSLCPPPDPQLFPDGIKTAWIKPGRAVWRYVDGGPSGLEGMKEFSRRASQLGFEHHIIEGFWSRWSMEERKEFVEYSRQLGVGVWFWRHSQTLRTPEARDEFFKMLHDLGVTGAKIDFLDHEHKEIIDLYEALLRQAAEHQILVNFHGANKPTGRERTWPNDAVREAVKGMEASRLTERARHQATLPFTRLLAGPADYTTMIFSSRRGDTTWANQIASMAVFSSPLLTLAANPHSILTNAGVEMIKSIPAIWDETRVLPGSEVGELAAFARRSGTTWFVAALCGPAPKTLNVPLEFLEADRYEALILEDDLGTTAQLKLGQRPLHRADTLTVDLGPGGGFVARLRPAK